MTILFDSARTVKPETFARGIPSMGRRPYPYTQADLDWAAQAFGDAKADRENGRLDEQAQEAAWYDQFHDTVAATGHCLNCGDRCDDLTSQGLCDVCDMAATESGIACINGLHGLGRRVF